MFQRSQLKEGMTVRSFDGEKLGRVFALSDDAFHIEKGLFFPKDYLVRYADISDIRDGEIILLHGRESLRRLSGDEKYSTTSGLGADTTAGMSTGATSGLGLGATDTGLRADASTTRTERSWEGGGTDEVAIPVHKEQLDVTKREVQAGEVRIHKEVVEEVKTVDVPVRRERVRVERRDVTPDRPAMNASFQDETVVVPVRAEEVDIHKRPVVDEEVVIHKDAIEEERRVAEPLRHEEVDVRTSGETEDSRKLNLGPDDDPLLRRR
ncbi:YsnF/AvaK domain-containing protein [Archangium violaceum]|uniref:YsnF/AvaK domain-containing protein n=1 Tax=Archangium violaceum TaxID=83451 RepID=UPI0019506058|nr:YsnF/AvaK domain-containing protein [Archangium violaceum]QRN99660.1 YsnF/AvaK domain-containing protein [Archangium violaceum]